MNKKIKKTPAKHNGHHSHQSSHNARHSLLPDGQQRSHDNNTSSMNSVHVQSGKQLKEVRESSIEIGSMVDSANDSQQHLTNDHAKSMNPKNMTLRESVLFKLKLNEMSTEGFAYH